MKKRKEMDQIILLIDKYFEGKTSLEEEAFLREYFLQEEVPQELVLYQPIFNCISRERGEQVVRKPEGPKVWFSRKTWLYASGAAILIGLALLFLPEYRSGQSVSLVYIDGKAYTDTELLQEQVLRSLEGISADNTDVLSSQIDVLNLFQE